MSVRKTSAGIGGGGDSHADEGVDPYARPSYGERYEQMIEEGRERYLHRLSVAVGGGAVKMTREMVDGDSYLDKFRVDSASSSGFTDAQRSALAKLADSVLATHVPTTLHVLVSHSKYDVRPFCVDLQCGPLVLILAIDIIGLAFVYYAASQAI